MVRAWGQSSLPALPWRGSQRARCRARVTLPALALATVAMASVHEPLQLASSSSPEFSYWGAVTWALGRGALYLIQVLV